MAADPDPPDAPEEVAQPGTDELRRILLLTVADDELVTGHRSSYWTGVAPGLEEDLAFSTLAQDEINHADVWYQVLVGQGDREAVDAIGLGRSPDEYRHAVLCERPPNDFAYTLARHWLYDHFDDVRLDALTGSTDPDIAAVADKLRHEERYHLEHADHWFWKCVHGGQEARTRLGEGLERTFEDALWLCEPLPHEDRIVAEGLLTAYSATLLLTWIDRLVPMLDDADLREVIPEALEETDDGWVLRQDFFAEPGGRRGVHTDDFTEDVWPAMTELYREHPGATW